MANISGQLISNLNASHLPNGNGTYLSSGIFESFLSLSSKEKTTENDE